MSVPPQPWQKLRDLEPPLGSKRRVLSEAHAEIHSSAGSNTSKRRWLFLPVMSFATAIAVAFWLLSDGSSDSETTAAELPPFNVERVAPLPKTKAMTSPAQSPQPQLSIAQDDTLAIRLPDSTLDVIGPAVVQLTANGIRMEHGQVKVAGYAQVLGPTCQVEIRGDATISVVGNTLDVTIRTGTAIPSSANCIISHTSDLFTAATSESPDLATLEKHSPKALPTRQSAIPAPDFKAGVAETQPAVVLQKRPAQEPPPAPPVSVLRQQIDSYKHARLRLDTHPQATFQQLQEFVDNWPSSVLREEIEADMIRALVRMSRYKEAEATLQAFVKRHPKSTRTAQLTRWVREGL